MPRGTERNGQGRRVTAEDVGRPFVLVTADARDQMGMGGDLRGAAFAACKIAGLRLPRFESWSCHTPPDLHKRGFCAPAHTALPGRNSLRFRSAGRGADADRASRVTWGGHGLDRAGVLASRSLTLGQLRKVGAMVARAWEGRAPGTGRYRLR